MSSTNACTDPRVRSLVAAYELGLLAEAEKVEVEAHLRACDACRDDVWQMAPWTAEITGSAPQLARMLGADSRVRAQRRVSPEAWRSALRRWLSPAFAVPLAASLVLLLVFVGRGLRHGDVATLARVNPVAWSPLNVRAEDASFATRRFREGMESYAAGRWGDAIPALEEARNAGADLPDWKHTDDATFFLGLSWLLERRPADAIPLLRRAADSPVPPLADRARWYLAQAHLLQRDAGAARVVLEELSDSPVYGERAGELRSRLR